jgi:Uma2 family endonuclease
VALTSAPTVAEPTPHRFTVAEYRAMVPAGILSEADRVELLDGVIYDMPPPGEEHNYSTNAGLADDLKERLGNRVVIWVQSSFRLDDASEPEPDVALLKPPRARYRHRIPTPDDAFLVIEVAYSTLAHDRARKVPAYARAGVPEVWVVNWPEQTIERWAEPAGGEYRQHEVFGRGQTLAPRAFPDCHLAVDDVLG